MANQRPTFSGSDVIYPPVADNGSPGGALVTAPPPPVGPVQMVGAPSHGTDVLHGGFNQTWLANCLRRRWLMATLLGLLLGAITFGLLLLAFPNNSRITAYLTVKSKAGSDAFTQTSERLSPQEIERQAMNHLAMIMSPGVLDAALTRQEIAQLDAVRAHDGHELLWLIEELKVSYPGDGEILEIRYEGDEDPAQMVKVVDAVVDAYKEKVLFQDRLQSAGVRTDLTTVLGKIKTRLQKQLEAAQQQATASGVLTDEIEIPKLRAKIQMLDQMIVRAREQLVELEVFRQMAMASANSPAAVDAAIAMDLDKDPMLTQYQQQLFMLQQALQSAQAQSKNQASAQIKRIAAQLQQTQETMDEYRRSARKAMLDKYRSMPNENYRTAMLEYQVREKAAKESLAKYEKDLADAERELLEMGGRNPGLEMLEADIESERVIATNLAQKVGEWQIEQEAREAEIRANNNTSQYDKVSIFQPASAIEDINKVERWSIASIGGLAALALTCYGVALLEFRHRRLNGPTDIDEGLGIRVLGVLPPTSLKALAGSSLTATQVAESIDNVRATLMHESTAGARQVVMVCSPGTMEGTTIVASSLALSLSRAGRRTLLIDGDLRAPSLHKLFGMPLEEGLSEALRAEIDLADAVKPTNNEKLYLLTAGVCNAEAIHALATEQPQAIIDKLRSQYDFIIIDAPPILGVSDSLSMGQYVDAAVLTVLRDHSEVRKVNQAAELLKRMGIRLIGCVVNGVPCKADRRVVRLHQASVNQGQPQLTSKVDG